MPHTEEYHLCISMIMDDQVSDAVVETELFIDFEGREIIQGRIKSAVLTPEQVRAIFDLRVPRD